LHLASSRSTNNLFLSFSSGLEYSPALFSRRAIVTDQKEIYSSSCSNVFALLTPILENSFTLSLAFWTDLLNASKFANIALFTNLVTAIVLSAKALTNLSVTCLGVIQLDVNAYSKIVLKYKRQNVHPL